MKQELESKFWQAFKCGNKASREFNSNPLKVKNPHQKDTEEFYGWNEGWNSHYNKSWRD